MTAPVKIILEIPSGYVKTDIIDAIKNKLKCHNIGLLCVKEQEQQPNAQSVTLFFKH